MPDKRAEQAKTTAQGAAESASAPDWAHDPGRFLAHLLPSLEELAAREETVKVTITLSKASVEFFKREARLRQTQYQKMIRRLLDEYVERQLQYSQR
jgi:hypothetical protein